MQTETQSIEWTTATDERQALADLALAADDWVSQEELEAAMAYLESLGWPTPAELTPEQAAEFERVQADTMAQSTEF